MALYLVVAHQTAASPELLSTLEEIARGDAEAGFVLLVPATPVMHLLTWTEGESLDVARSTATEAGRVLRSAGLNLLDTVIGVPDPLDAIESEHQFRSYDRTVISTLPLGVSRWLKRDLPTRARSKLGIEVVHVTSQPAVRRKAVA